MVSCRHNNYDLLYSRRWKVHDLSLNGALIQADRTDLPPGVSVALRFRQYDNRASTARVDLLFAS